MEVFSDPVHDSSAPQTSPLARIEFGLERLHVSRWIEPAAVIFAVTVAAITWAQFSDISLDAPIAPPFAIASLVVANLAAGTLLLMLVGRRLAKGRAENSVLGGGAKLHVRLVMLFSLTASVPVVLMVLFASFLFQNGVEFWFSDRARSMLENASSLAQSAYASNRERVVGETVGMGSNLRNALSRMNYTSPEFVDIVGREMAWRELSEAVLLRQNDERQIQSLVLVNPHNRNLTDIVTPENIQQIESGKQFVVDDGGRIFTVIKLPDSDKMYLYAARDLDPALLQQSEQARAVVADYRSLTARSRALQIQFNLALVIVSLLIMAAIVWFALQLADRLVRPVSALAGAAQRISEGDLSARVPEFGSDDEFGRLTIAFNRMTERLEEQTGALMNANHALDERNAFMHAVLTGVSAGVISLDEADNIRLVNRAASEFFNIDGRDWAGEKLSEISPVLSEFVHGDQARSILDLPFEGTIRTIAANRESGEQGAVLTFDDITAQLADQRRAAWADVARRIAHEIKNPLTPIQLAAERLQRRYGSKVDESADGTFAQLTDTIVRQVGDLRRMIDEFSSFARMPKPMFREEILGDIIRQSMFLQEVANPDIVFNFKQSGETVHLVCDHRQLGQAFTNILKNAVEAIELKQNQYDEIADGLVEVIVEQVDEQIIISVADNGIGIPDNRDDLFEPYVTTWEKGTGLGLAIVQKIVQEHLGVMEMIGREGGGTIVTITFDVQSLQDAMTASSPSELSG